MRTLRKYTGFLAKIHSFALIFSFFFIGATPQISKSFAQPIREGTKVLKAPLAPVALEGEFLVQFRSEKSLNAIKKGNNPKWISKLGKDVKIDTRLSSFNIAHIQVSNPAGDGNWKNLANILSSDPDVYAVEPNYVVYANTANPASPNDPHINKMWFLDKIKAFEAWSQPSSTTEDIIVAVVDTGVKFTHEDLKGHIWINKKEIPDNKIDDNNNGLVDDIFGWNFYEGNNWPGPIVYPAPTITPDDQCHEGQSGVYTNLHGTHVAGTIAAMGNNAKGIKGIADKVKIMPLKVLGGACGRGDTIDVLAAIIYAYENGARIINLSLGSFAHSFIAQRIYEDLAAKGVLFVIAAGNETVDNDGEPRSYPASYPIDGILSVAATTPTDDLAEFSNWGRKNVDIAAPGVDIFSTIVLPNEEKKTLSDSYNFESGTSMASPIVSGAAALLLAHQPTLTNLQIKETLMNSVDPIPGLANKVASGGRLNLQKALMKQSTRQPSRAPKPAQEKQKARSVENHIDGIRIFDRRTQREERIKW
ncbi:MAG: S8 family peptidase [Terasakiella sp.]|uniref:S8 family peptidase n=1 Tax=unclassified Terasakiella TaxID=2614952 RepID=UPI003B00E462